jgi:anaerobic magnesium-protoporphyrin IX monomethyl ester cyclase
MKAEVDLLVISPGNNQVIYQDLAKEYAAVEPPIWASLITNFAKTKGYGVCLIDQEGEGIATEQIVKRAIELKPRLIAIIVYGQQPSASTQNMTRGIEIATALKESASELKSIMIGGHPSALPQKTLEESPVDFVCQGEGPYTLDALLQLPNLTDESNFSKVPGLWYRQNGKALFSKECPVIPEKELSTTLPGMTWDILPMQSYRSHNWHSFAHLNDRKPYASIHTSLGCPFRCSFCCINAPFGNPSIRYWDPHFIIQELDVLANKYHVKNIKIADEMFVLNERHVLTLCDLIIERGYQFNFWAYARVDTVKDKFLEKLKKAGFNWLCLGIESASKHVRDGVQKGRFKEEDIRTTVKRIKDAGIYIIGNYIFGLPDDDYDSMQNTLDMALELNCEMANFYSGTAYPGSRLYNLAVEKGWRLPDKWHDFSQHSFEQIPLPTENISAGEVLNFRDKAWQIYFTDAQYLNLVRKTFGQNVVDHIQKLTTIKLKRKYAVPLKVEPHGRAKSESLTTTQE